MAPLQPAQSSHQLPQTGIVALSCFVAICLCFFLALVYTVIRQRLSAKSAGNNSRPRNCSCSPSTGIIAAARKRSLFRRYSYDTFDCHSKTPSILLEEQFIQPPASTCRSTILSPIHESHSEGLRVPVLSLRRHSAPKSILSNKRRHQAFINRPANSCIQFSPQGTQCPVLHFSISYVHTVELLRVVVDKVVGLPERVPHMVYTIRIRVMPRSRTSAYLSKPLVTPAVSGKPEFDHLFEYAVSLHRLERAKIEMTLFAKPWKSTLASGQRRFTVGAIPYATNGTKPDVNLTELLKEYKELGTAEFVLDTCVLRSNPGALEHLDLPLSLVEGDDPSENGDEGGKEEEVREE